MTVSLDTFTPRCPYCQSTELIRMIDGATIGGDDIRCPGCGSRFSAESLSEPDATQQDLSVVVCA